MKTHIQLHPMKARPSDPLKNCYATAKFQYSQNSNLSAYNQLPNKTKAIFMNNLNNLNDYELIQLFQNGHSNALSVLAERHKKKIFTSIVLLIKDHHSAEDLFQDLFIRIINTITQGKYNEEGKFLPWALRIAHNMSIDHLRKAKTSSFIRHTDDNSVFERISAHEPAAEEHMITAQAKEKIRKLIDLLPDEQREVVVMRHYADMSFKEIAQLTNCSLNTALGRMRYAVINLRKLIAEHATAV